MRTPRRGVRKGTSSSGRSGPSSASSRWLEAYTSSKAGRPSSVRSCGSRLACSSLKRGAGSRQKARRARERERERERETREIPRGSYAYARSVRARASPVRLARASPRARPVPASPDPWGLVCLSTLRSLGAPVQGTPARECVERREAALIVVVGVATRPLEERRSIRRHGVLRAVSQQLRGARWHLRRQSVLLRICLLRILLLHAFKKTKSAPAPLTRSKTAVSSEAFSTSLGVSACAPS